MRPTLGRCAVVLGVWLLACAPDSTPADAPRGATAGVRAGLTDAAPLVQRVALAGSTLVATERVLALLTPGPTWVPTSAHPRLGPTRRHGPGPFLHLRGGGIQSVRLPVPPDLARFNRVDLDFFARWGQIALTLTGLSGDKTVFRLVKQCVGREGLQHASFHVPLWAGALLAPDALVLELAGPKRGLIGAVTLVDEDWTARIPSPEPAPVAIAGRTRIARGISTDGPLLGEIHVPVDGVLRIAAGLPVDLRQPERAIELVVRLGKGADLVEHRLALPSSDAGDWAERRIELSGPGGRRLPLALELAAGDGAPAYGVVAEPLVCGRRSDPPTVLLITSDTHRFDHLAASEHGVSLETPALDALARDGVLYASCFAATNVTIPSHAALLTGVHVRDTRLTSNLVSLSGAAPTLAERFRDSGFVTLACVSTAHLDHTHSGLGQGFDRMDGPAEAEFRAEETVRRAAGLLADAEGLPVFLWVHLFDAHTPYAPPATDDRRYYPADRDPRDGRLPGLLAGQAVPGDPGVRDLEFPRAQYRAEISYLDRELGRLLEHPRLCAATVLFTADHGESLGEHEIYWDHAGLYPDTVQVPLLLAGPGVPAGRRVFEPVSQIDAGRTLLDLAGLTEVEFPGASLLEPLAREQAAERRYVARRPRFAIGAHGLEASIHSGPWFLILVLRPYRVNPRFDRSLHALELFDLVADHGCVNDLAGREPETTRRLRNELIAWLADARSTGWDEAAPDDVEALRRMAELGYTDLGAVEEPGWIAPDCTCPNCARWK